MFNGKPLVSPEMEAHLSILRTYKNTNLDSVQSVKTSRQAAYSFMCAGFNGLNGIEPEIALIQYKMYVLPTLLYRLEALVLGKEELNILGAYDRKVLHCIQHLLPSTAIPAIRLLSGIGHIEAMLDT